MDKAGTEWAVVQWWMSSLLVSRGGGRGRCGRRSRSGEVDAAGSEWAMVRRWMSSLGFREGRGERAMKYGRRDVRCSGAVELVVFAGGERKWGAVWWGEPEVTKAAPTYYVDEGGIVTVGLRAPRTKGEFRMLKTKVAEILEGGGRFCRPRDRSYPVSTNFGPC